MKQSRYVLLSGLVWGLVEVALFWRSFGHYGAYFVLSGPLIAVLVYAASRPFYPRPWWVWALWTVPSLYLGLACSSAVVAAVDVWVQGDRSVPYLTDAGLYFFTYGWLILRLPVFWPIFPLAFLNHVWLARRLKRKIAPSASPNQPT